MLHRPVESAVVSRRADAAHEHRLTKRTKIANRLIAIPHQKGKTKPITEITVIGCRNPLFSLTDGRSCDHPQTHARVASPWRAGRGSR
ncbi:hypothetical protein CBM2623_B160034 [Cupriavidus taiwanensis]|nr:hypothetical protein CBM2608_B140035 [Cupriavidus taiwanensis]SPA32573.1 hypothetical protein CBM2623_B160034 [Cupriavidus taiwanensis]